jgi:hypothetical protein
LVLTDNLAYNRHIGKLSELHGSWKHSRRIRTILSNKGYWNDMRIRINP